MISSKPRPSSGVALVLVLSILVLLAGLVLAFFTSVTADNSASKVYAAGIETNQLAATAVNVVMAQIKDGTAGVDANGGTLAWASQPGLLRNWDTTGNLSKIYKLYSSDQMVVSGFDPSVGFDPGADSAPVGWGSQSALFTDLNSPV